LGGGGAGGELLALSNKIRSSSLYPGANKRTSLHPLVTDPKEAVSTRSNSPKKRALGNGVRSSWLIEEVSMRERILLPGKEEVTRIADGCS